MLHAIRMIKCFFNPRKLKIFLNANYYSVLFYNSEIWLTSHLNSGPKQQLLSASAKAICSCTNFTNRYISFEKVHADFKKATPCQFTQYKTAILLYKIFNDTTHGKDWQEFTNQIICSGRQTSFEILKINNYKIGKNILSNRLASINRKVDLNLLNLPLFSFKREMKDLFLVYEWSVSSILCNKKYYNCHQKSF